jgi:hypothetical protein
MDATDNAESLAALKKSIRESEASLRQLKKAIQAVDARLKPHRTVSESERSPDRDEAELI